MANILVLILNIFFIGASSLKQSLNSLTKVYSRPLNRFGANYDLPLTKFSRHYLFSNAEISEAFNVATFLPQPVWTLMIFCPTLNFTRRILEPWWSIILFSLVHLFIVTVSITQADGTAPLTDFTEVFNPSGNPLKVMVSRKALAILSCFYL